MAVEISLTSKQLMCEAQNSCLLVIDIQTRLTAAMPAKVLDRLKRNSTLLLKTADLLSIPVFVSQQYPQGLGPIEPDIETLLAESHKHYEKTCFSCANVDEFRHDLNQSGRKQVIIIGLEAHVCVLQTAIDLYSAGYHVFVVLDAVCSRQRENYENAMQRLQHSGITVCNSESVLFEWLRDAAHQQFKTVSSLVR
jgi:nicotinamidase-related amidase